MRSKRATKATPDEQTKANAPSVVIWPMEPSEILDRIKKEPYDSRYTPCWEMKLLALSKLGTDRKLPDIYLISAKFAHAKNISGIKTILDLAPPKPVNRPDDWNSLLHRLNRVRLARGYHRGWVKHQYLGCGRPPLANLKELAQLLGYSDKWVKGKWEDSEKQSDELPSTISLSWGRLENENHRYR
jgi:hypothetical protein